MVGTDSRVLIVGEDFGSTPPQYHDDVYALTGYSGARLAYLSGMTEIEFYSRTERTNIVKTPEDWFDKDKVSFGVDRVFRMAARRRMILLGVKVAVACRAESFELFEWKPLYGVTVARAPHPSGRNRMLNEQQTVKAFSDFMRETLR